MVLVNKCKIFHVFLSCKLGQENVVDDILQRKYAFLDYKNELKTRKIDFFPKGLVHGFGQTFETFPFSYFSQNRPGNIFHDLLKQRNVF